MRKNSTKNNRINGEVTRAISEIIRTVKDPRVGVFTSVMDAVVAPDLKTCRVYVSVLGDEDEKKSTLEGLNRAKGYIRRELAHTVNLRNTPDLTFIMNDSIAYGIDMSKRIDDVIAADEAARALKAETDLDNSDAGADLDNVNLDAPLDNVGDEADTSHELEER